MSSMNLRLRAGEKLYINGAVIKVDRRVSVEVLNDVTFLLEGRVLQAEHATTPLKQLYFAIQSALMEPENILAIVPMVTDMLSRTMATFQNSDVRRGLLDVGELIDRGRFFEALRVVRGLYPVELDILNARVSSPEAA